MKCTKARNLFSDYLESTLKPELKAAFERHVAECQHCREDYERFQAAVQLVDGVREVQLPPNFHDQVMARVAAERRAVAHPVRWWQIDWQNVFSTRMPARAAAVAVAVVLAAALLIQLTPLNSITANLLWQRASDTVPYGEPVDAPPSPLPWGITDSGKGACDAADTALSLSVRRDRSNKDASAYLLRVETCGRGEVDFQVDLLTPVDGEIRGHKIYTGSVAGKDDAVIPVVIANKKKDVAVARVTWRGASREYSKYAFVPAHLQEAAARKPVRMLLKDAAVYDALRAVCSKYGVIIISSGDIDTGVEDVDAQFSTAGEALEKVVSPAGFKVHKLAADAYVVEPSN